MFPSRVLWVLDFCRVHARETLVSATFYLHACSHSCPRFCEKRLGQFLSLCLSCHFVAAASCGFWIFVACMRPNSQFWHQLLLKLISLRVPRAYAHQRIHAQTIVPLVFQEQSITRASMPNHNNVRVPRAIDHQSIHAQTIMTFVFQVHTLTRESMPKP